MTSERPSAGKHLTGAEKKAYDLLKKEIERVANGDSTDTVFQISFKDLFPSESFEKEYTTDNLNLASLGEYDEAKNTFNISNDARDKMLEDFPLDTGKVFRALVADCPYHLYWFDKTEGMTTGSELRSTVFSDQNHQNWRIKINNDSEYTFTFSTSSDYAAPAGEDGSYFLTKTDASTVQSISTAKTNAEKVVSDAKDESDYNKLVYYKEFICSETSYNEKAGNNTSTPYGDPWQLIYVFDSKPSTNVVCEGYSKAFKYLCDLSAFSGSIDCFLMTGQMTGGKGAGEHMWNVVNMNDDKNYLVDVTNCDEGTIGYPNNLFLVGTSDYTDQTYQFTFNDQSISYKYDGDTLSTFTDSELLLSALNYTVPSDDNTGGDNTGGNTGGDNTGGDNTGGNTGGGNTGGDNTGGNTGGDNTGGDNTGGNTGGDNTGGNTGGDNTGGNTGGDNTSPAVDPTPAKVKIDPTVILNARSFTYTGRNIFPRVTVKHGNKVIPAGNYDLIYNYAGNFKSVGTHRVTVKMKGNYEGSKTVSFVINPKATMIKAPKAGKRSFTARWNKQLTKMSSRQINGYQVQYSLKKNFRSGVKTKNVNGAKKTSVKIGKLKGKKTYYVRVRTFMKVSGKTYYSPWSSTKKVRTKK